MTNIEQLLERIKALPEIELQEFMEELEGHLDRENLDHLSSTFSRSKISSLEERIEELEEEVKDGEKLLDEARDEAEDSEKVLGDVKKILQDIVVAECGVDYAQEKINEILEDL
jgi:DNA replicative helicase MCM subunit Mcm2 (Cdc46/Mcm family)